MVGQFQEKRLGIGVTSAQGIEAHPLTSKVDLAAHQSVHPVFGDTKGFSEQMDVAVLIAWGIVFLERELVEVAGV
ncbi:MAG: hypothetical protein ACREBU_13565 [Nitrososphaera sp.]